MKTLINKADPQVRITAPEIRDGKYTYMVDYISGHDSENKHHTFYLWKESWTLVEEEYIENRNDGTYTCSTTNDFEEEPTCKESLQVEEEHPDNFTSFEWLVGRLMFRGCDLWGMTDGEDDNGIVTKLIKDRAAEMMELLERELDPNAEPVDLEKEIKKHTDLFQADIEYPLRLTAIKFYELGRKGGK